MYFLLLSHLLMYGQSSDLSNISLYRLLHSGALPSMASPWPARKHNEVSCFSRISLLVFWFVCNCVSSWVATLGCCDTRNWNWATLSLWCLLFVCSLNVSTACFQLLKLFTVKAGSFLLTPRFFIAQHCVQKSFPLVSQCQPVSAKQNPWTTDIEWILFVVKNLFLVPLVLFNTSGLLGWWGVVRSLQHSLEQLISRSWSWLSWGGQLLPSAWFRYHDLSQNWCYAHMNTLCSCAELFNKNKINL